MIFTEYLIAAPQSTPDGVMEELKRVFTEAEIIEICWTTLYFNIPHRYGSAMGVDAPDHDNLVLKSALPDPVKA